MNTSYKIKDRVPIDVAAFTDEQGSIGVLDKRLQLEVKRASWLRHIADGKGRRTEETVIMGHRSGRCWSGWMMFVCRVRQGGGIGI